MFNMESPMINTFFLVLSSFDFSSGGVIIIRFGNVIIDFMVIFTSAVDIPGFINGFSNEL